MQDRLERRLGNYRLTRLLAQGGFAEVYLAQHIYLNSQAAIKVLLAQLSGDDMQSFLNEARTVVDLVHPHIVRVLEFGVEGNTPFLVMDYAPHGSLRQCYPRGSRLPLPTVAAYVRQAASALHYAHERRLIHRDIKPENMLLGRNNELLISDFGIAVLAHSSLSAHTQQIVGTAAYMAPEQVQGRPRPASDQYALALIAYEWLCGERPFHGSLVEIATQQLFSEPPQLREKVPDISPAVEEVIFTALAKDPAGRYSTVMDFAAALECAGQPLPRVARSSFSLNSGPLVVGSTDPAPAETHSAATQQEFASVATPGVRKRSKLFAGAGIKSHQLFSVALGVLLFALVNNFVLLIHLSPAYGSELLWILPALTIPIAYGAIYGCRAGLLTGGLGSLAGSYISIVIRSLTLTRSPINILTLSALHLPWYFYLGFLSIGSIAGFTTFFTQGRYHSLRNILIAESFSCIGILGGFCIVFNALWPPLYAHESVMIDFTHIALPNMLLVLLVLPLILTLHSRYNTEKDLRQPERTYT